MQFFIFVLLLLSTKIYCQNTFVCPSIAEIKSGQFNGWLPLYIQNEELASLHDIENFKSSVTNFSMAKWSTLFLEYGHCYYQGTDPIVDKIILAKDAWHPSQNNWLWKVDNHLAECNGEIIQCEFVS